MSAQPDPGPWLAIAALAAGVWLVACALAWLEAVDLGRVRPRGLADGLRVSQVAVGFLLAGAGAWGLLEWLAA